jgi:OHCU decarboxylase
MTLAELNEANPTHVRVALLRCCGSTRWADAVLALRPFPDGQALLAAAESVWWTLGKNDWLSAFSAHPKIAERSNTTWSADEQRAVNGAAPDVLTRLVEANEEYRKRFGWIFLVNATGKSVPEILELLATRLKNDEAHELRIAAGEQAKITKLRLRKLLNE